MNEWVEKSAGRLNGPQSSAHAVWKVHEGKLAARKQIVLAALVDDPHESVLGCPRVRHYWVHLANNQRGFIAFVVQAQRKLLG